MIEQDTSSILALISRIHSSTADFLAKKLSEQGLEDMTSSYGNILFRLSLEKKLTMSDLAKKINRNKSTLTVLVRNLEKEGFVNRQVSQEDSRITYIYLSEKGKAYTNKTRVISQELIETCYKGFSDAEKQQVFSLLNRISNNFE